jgi:hypothetical protein
VAACRGHRALRPRRPLLFRKHQNSTLSGWRDPVHALRVGDITHDRARIFVDNHNVCRERNVNPPRCQHNGQVILAAFAAERQFSQNVIAGTRGALRRGRDNANEKRAANEGQEHLADYVLCRYYSRTRNLQSRIQSAATYTSPQIYQTSFNANCICREVVAVEVG